MYKYYISARMNFKAEETIYHLNEYLIRNTDNYHL